MNDTEQKFMREFNSDVADGVEISREREAEFRRIYGIREATPEELAMMTSTQRWHYDAAAHKPVGMPFWQFRYQGEYVRPLALTLTGGIDVVSGTPAFTVRAHLRPFSIRPILAGA